MDPTRIGVNAFQSVRPKRLPNGAILEPTYAKALLRKDSITLYNGDCREILPQLQAESVDMALTDPPYLVRYSGRWGSDWSVVEGDADQGWVLPVNLIMSCGERYDRTPIALCFTVGQAPTYFHWLVRGMCG